MLPSLFEKAIIALTNRALDRAGRRPGPTAGRPAPAADPGTDPPVVLGDLIPSAMDALRRGIREAVPVSLSTDLRRRHTYILGSTGSGKTNLLVHVLRSDFAAGRAVCLLDARGDLVDRAMKHLAAEHAEGDLAGRLLLIDLRTLPEAGSDSGGGEPDYVVGFNPLQQAGPDPYTCALFVLDVLRQLLGSALGVQTEETMRNCLLAIAMAGGTLMDVEPVLTDATFRREVLERVTDGGVRRFFTRFDALPSALRTQWTTPILNKISPWLARPSLKKLLGSSVSVSLRDHLNARPDAIVLVCLGADELFGAAHLIGSLVVSAVASAVMRTDRPVRHPCFMYLDEFENFGGEQFEGIVSEGRRFSLGLILSHQASSQISPALRSLIRNVVATQIFFATGGLDAEALAGEIPGDEPKAVLRNLLMSQGVGEAVVSRRGLPTVRIRTKHTPDPDVPARAMARLRREVLRAHGRPASEVEAELDAHERRLDGQAMGTVRAGADGLEVRDPLEVRDIEANPQEVHDAEENIHDQPDSDAVPRPDGDGQPDPPAKLPIARSRHRKG